MVQVSSAGYQSRSLAFAAVSAPGHGVVAVGGVQFSNKFGLEPGLPTGISFATAASPDAPCLSFAPTGSPSATPNTAGPTTPTPTPTGAPSATPNTTGPITSTVHAAVWWEDGVGLSNNDASREVGREDVGAGKKRGDGGGDDGNIVVDVWVFALIIGGILAVLVLVTTALFVWQARAKRGGGNMTTREQSIRRNVAQALAALPRLAGGNFVPRARRVSGTDASGTAIYAEIDDILYEEAPDKPRFYEYDEHATVSSGVDGKRQLQSPINPMFLTSRWNGQVGVPRGDDAADRCRSPDLEWDGTDIYDSFEGSLSTCGTIDGFYTVR